MSQEHDNDTQGLSQALLQTLGGDTASDDSQHPKPKTEPEAFDDDPGPDAMLLDDDEDGLEPDDALPDDMDWNDVYDEMGDALPDAVDLASIEDEESLRLFYLREAQTLSMSRPERAALMWLEAAIAAENDGDAAEIIRDDLETALELCPKSPWLLPRARRVLMRQRSYERALELCLLEVEQGGDSAKRAAILLEAAALERYYHNRPRPALSLVERALSLENAYIPALTLAIGLHTELDQHAETATALETLSDTIDNPLERAIALYTAGTLLETRENAPDEAEIAYQRAIEADPDHLPALLALAQLHERLKMWPELARTTELLAALVPDNPSQARLYYKAGALHLDRTQELDAAARNLSRSAHVEPRAPLVLERLAYCYDRKGRPRELLATLGRLLELVPDALRRADLHTRRGQLMAHTLHEPEQAREAFAQALDAIPLYLPALYELDAIFRVSGKTRQRITLLSRVLESGLPTASRAAIATTVAALLVDEERFDEAIAYYERALELDPSLTPARWALADQLYALARYEELAQSLSLHAQQTTDTKTRTHLQLSLARLQSGPLQSAAEAIQTLSHIEHADTSRSVSLELMALLEREGRYGDLVEQLLRESRDTEDRAESEGWTLRAAAVLEDPLGEHERALSLYQQVLSTAPANAVATQGVIRIALHLERWSELVRIYRHQLKLDRQRPDAPIIHFQIGEILAHHLHQPDEAIVAFSAAIASDPNFSPALRALERLVRTQERWSELIEVLERAAAATSNRQVASDALCRAAELGAWRLDQLELAARLFERAIDLNPRNFIARYGLLSVHHRASDWNATLHDLESLLELARSHDERAMIQLEMARVRELRLGGEPDLELYLGASQESTHGDRLRGELTRVRRLKGSPDLAEWLSDLGHDTHDPILASAYLLESALIHELAHKRTDDALRAARQAYTRNTSELSIIWSFERTLWSNGAFSLLGKLREQAAQLETDPDIRVLLLTDAISAYMEADAFSDAERLSRECLNFDAHCLPALLTLAELAENNQRWREYASLCDRLAEACSNEVNRLDWCLRAAEHWVDRVGDGSRALASLAVALSDNPTQHQAFTLAEELLRERGDFDELSRLYVRRIDATPKPGSRIELLRSHAELLRDDIGATARASAELAQLLLTSPHDVRALSALAALLCEQERWAEAAGCLDTLIHNSQETGVRHHARLQLADICLRKLHQPARAHDALEEALEERPDDLETRKFMVDLATHNGNWDEARDFLEEIAERGEPNERIWAMMRLAEVAERGLWDSDLQLNSEREALRIAASRPRILDTLIAHYREKEALDRFVEIGEGLIQSWENVSEDISPLRDAIAQLLIDGVGAPGRAIRYLEGSLRRDPQNEDARLLLAQARERQGELEDAADQFRILIERNPSHVEAWSGLVRLMDRLGRPETADAASMLLELLTGNASGRSILDTDHVHPKGHLDLASTLPMPSELRPIQNAFSGVLPYLGKIFPPHVQGRRVPTDSPLSANVRIYADGMGLPSVHVFIVPGEEAHAVPGDGLTIHVGETVANKVGSDIFRFWIGRALTEVSSCGALLEDLDDHQLETLLDAVCTRSPSNNTAKLLRKRLAKTIPRRLRKPLLSHELPNTNEMIWKRLRTLEARRADRVGLVFSRNIRVAIEELARIEGSTATDPASSERLSQLVRFALSEEHAHMVRKLWGRHRVSS